MGATWKYKKWCTTSPKDHYPTSLTKGSPTSLIGLVRWFSPFHSSKRWLTSFAVNMSLFERVKNDLQIAHVNQLKYLSGAVKQMPDTGEAAPISSKQDIMDWIDEQEKKGRIQKAKDNRKLIAPNRVCPS